MGIFSPSGLTEQLPGDTGSSRGCGDAASPALPRLNPSAWQGRGGKTNPQAREEEELTQAVKLNEILKAEAGVQLDRCPGCSEHGSASQHSSWTHTWIWERLRAQARSLSCRCCRGTAPCSPDGLQDEPTSTSPTWHRPPARLGKPGRSCRARGAPHVPGKALEAASQGLLPARRPKEHGKGLLAGISCSLCDPQALPAPPLPGQPGLHHAPADPVTSAVTPCHPHPIPNPPVFTPTSSQDPRLADSKAVSHFFPFSFPFPKAADAQAAQTPARNRPSRESSAPGCKQPPPQ